MADKILSIADGLHDELPSTTTAIAGRILITTDRGEMYYEPEDKKRIQVNPQADWQQNDETANDYVKNRPGGYEALTEILPETTLNFTGSTSLALTNFPPIEVGKTYTVTFYKPDTDSVEYELIGRNDSRGLGYVCIGNENITWGGGTDTTTPFVIFTTIANTTNIVISSSSSIRTYNIKIKAIAPIKIDEKYLDIKNTNIINGSKIGSLRTVGSSIEGSEYKIGDYAFAEGQYTKASGAGSHAEGGSTTALGGYSHAEGYTTKASGIDSHAEGYYTKASGDYSHAEGGYTTASGNNSHAEGNSTNLFSNVVTATNPTDDDITTAWDNSKFSLAKGESAHVEGINSLALGSSSHAEGSATQASGYSSHAEGFITKASAPHSHAEGESTKASGYASHAEGESTTASGSDSHAEGNNTKASGNRSHAEGNSTTALGDYSHAEGNSTVAGQMGFKVTACEKLTDTTGTYTLSSIAGLSTNQRYSIHLSSSKDNCGKITAINTDTNTITVDGYPNIALSTSSSSTANYLTIVGNPKLGDIKVSGDYSHAEGGSTQASGNMSHAEGGSTQASSDYQHVQGKYNIEDSNNIYADIIGNGDVDLGTRSNAATVDWNGNAWYAGDVYTGSTSGTNRDEGSKKLATEEYVNSTISSNEETWINVQADWQQNDETANDYVKNRPGGYEALTEILPETTLNFTNNRSLTLTGCPSIEVGKTYTVTFYHPDTDISEYQLVGQSTSSGLIYIGNQKHTWGGTDTGEPFIIYSFSTNTTSPPIIYISSSETLPCTYNIKIKVIAPIKIDEKYLDVKNTNIVNGSKVGSLRTVGSTKEGSGYEIGDYAFAEGSVTQASGYVSHAEGYYTTASGDRSHAEGSSTKASGRSSHSEGMGTTASGSESHAEGNATTASGTNSHAEGNSSNLFSNVVTATDPTNDDIITAWNSKKFSLAKGNSAHVEGNDNLSLGNYSHAEGYSTKALGSNSHAEGNTTKASAPNSHAEGGNTTASGYVSHAEGVNTIASGDFSHAEGNSTTASSIHQHVQGKLNIEDSNNIYADIIGNGSNPYNRSNAATVDWQGNAWYAGDVYVGSTSGTNKDEGSKKLATEIYTNTVSANAIKDSASGLNVVQISDKNNILCPVTHEMGVKVRGKNLIPYPYVTSSGSEINGITWTVNEDGSVIANGTATGNSNFVVIGQANPIAIAGKTVTLSGCPTGGSSTTYGIYYYDTVTSQFDYGNGVTFIPKGVVSVNIRIYGGATVENLTFKPQIELGSTATDYTPYVPDLTAVKVSRCGKNLLSAMSLYPTVTNNAVPIHFKAGQQYTISFTTTYTAWRLMFFGTDKNGTAFDASSPNANKYISGTYTGTTGRLQHASNLSGNTFTFTCNEDCTITAIVFWNVSNETDKTYSDFQLEIGSTATDYEPYKECVEYTPNADGTVNGVTSLYPNTTLMTDTDGVIIDCEYNVDLNSTLGNINTALDSIIEMQNSLIGGN